MTTPVIIPQLGMAMSEGKIVEWLVSDGDTVEAGQAILNIENDKAIQEIESPASGTIKLIGKEDEVYPIETVVAEIS